MPVLENTGWSPPASCAELVEIPVAELAVMVHKGGYGDSDRTYGALGTAVIPAVSASTAPSGSTTWSARSTPGAPDGEWRTEICWPVLRPPERWTGPEPVVRKPLPEAAGFPVASS